MNDNHLNINKHSKQIKELFSLINQYSTNYKSNKYNKEKNPNSFNYKNYSENNIITDKNNDIIVK